MNILIVITNTFRSKYNELFLGLTKDDTITVVSIINEKHFDSMSNKRKLFLFTQLRDFTQSLKAKNIIVNEVFSTPSKIANQLLLYNSYDEIRVENQFSYDEILENRKIESLAKKHNIEYREFNTQTSIDYKKYFSSIQKVPDTFTSFRKIVEKQNCYHVELPQRQIPSCNSVDLNMNLSQEELAIKDEKLLFTPTEQNASEHLQNYIWKSEYIKTYKKTRNQMIGDNFSTKFSYLLNFGLLNVKEILYEINSYEEQRVSNSSTYWVKFELLWREYSKFISLKYGKLIFLKKGIMDKHIYSNYNKEFYDAFIQGKTGYALVDAGIRELKKTGFMSNRARQNVASFFVKNLHLPWIMGAEFFEKYLLDYDPASNYLNWQYITGCGTDSREFRYFNIAKQTKDYDPKHEFISYWVPEYKDPSYNKIVDFYKSIEVAKKEQDLL